MIVQSAKLGVAHWQRALSASKAATHAAVQRNLNQAEQYLDDVQKQVRDQYGCTFEVTIK